MTDFKPGERFAEMQGFQMNPDDPGIWSHLGWRRTELSPGSQTLEWEPGIDHSFPAGDSWIVHGGMVTALLDTAMGGATWTLLDSHEVFLTVDLRTEFYRATLPGAVTARGWVVHKTRRVTFAAAEMFDAAGKMLASGRATNLTIDLRQPQDKGRESPASPARG